MSISTPFIRRPIATSLLTAAIFLAGLVAYPLLPVAPLPNVQFPTLTVTAQYPGASPETMASTVATPLETEFGQMLPGLAQMTSASVLGTTHDHVAVQPQYRPRQCRDAGVGGDERGAGLAAEGHAEPADVPRDQSGRQPDHDPGDAVGPGTDHRGGQLRREPGGAADFAASGGGPGAGGRTADAGDPRAGRSGAAGVHGPDIGGRAQRPDQCHGG